MRKNDLSFKMSLSRPVRLVTWISSAAILLGVAVCAYTAAVVEGGGWVFWLIAACMLLIPLYFAFRCPRDITLDEEALSVRQCVGGVSIPYRDIAEVEPISRYSSLRLCASGGFFGFTGLFWSNELGKHTVVAGNLKSPFLVALKSGKKYVFNCDASDKLLSSLRMRLPVS